MRSTLPTFNEVWQQQFRSSVLTQVQRFSEQTSFLVGCSGGMDSMLLLFLMSVLFPQKVRAIYIDHQLQAVSSSWGDFVQHECQSLSIPCIIQPVNVAAGNLEQQARQARYQAYQQHLLDTDILVLAHHQQDQAETVLLRLLSGTGIHGLAAMKKLDIREQFSIWRPLLDVSREQIAQWVLQLNLRYVDDPTNADVHYDRAWCRQQLWPLLQQRFPAMQQAIFRTSLLMQDAEQILHGVLAQDWQNCGNQQQLSLDKLQQLSAARQRQLLSAWMKGEAIYRPGFEQVERLQQEVIQARADAQALLHWHEFYFVRFKKTLYRLNRSEYLASQFENVPADLELEVEMASTLPLMSGTYAVASAEMGLSPALLQQKLHVRQRQGGEKIHLHGRVGSWPLKKAIQAAEIVPWLRHRIQILSIDNVMLGVFTPQGFWLAESPYCEPGGWQPVLVSSVN